MRSSIGLPPRDSPSHPQTPKTRSSAPSPLASQSTPADRVRNLVYRRTGNPHVSVRLSHALLARLQSHAESAGVSRSEIVRAALILYLGTVQAKEGWG